VKKLRRGCALIRKLGDKRERERERERERGRESFQVKKLEIRFEPAMCALDPN